MKKILIPLYLKPNFIDEYTNSKVSGIYDLNDNPLSKEKEKEFCEELNKNIKDYDLVIVVDFGHGLVEKSSKYFEKNQNS